MAAAGRTEIVHAVDLVITDAARETAHDLGVRIVNATQRPPPAQPAPNVPAVPAASQSAPALEATVAARAPRGSDPLVQALVDAVRANLTIDGVVRKG